MNNLIFLISTPGIPEILLIAVVLLLLFGGRKIPELMRGLGKGMNEFKKAKSEMDSEMNKEDSKPEEKEKK
ncbi:twin-arginine translocase TatA/TatE family subunit [Saccharicrinis sp. FJH54]|uniref:Sec-independent protein translocase subunit TatA/TatB n=1 Tax=Saccharicrinis sp. FJH54 TaxID=3344665 RepID=UPI0035D48143